MQKKLDKPATFKIFDKDIDNKTEIALRGSLALAIDTEAMGLIHGRDRPVSYTHLTLPTIYSV